MNDSLQLPPGTFAPAPRRASYATMALAQGRMESILFLRHGEQQILSIIIPLAMLIIASQVPILGEGNGVKEVLPMVLAIATTSSSFTGQAISLAFDRRYGALKRTGASGVPAGIIIAGKIIAVLVMALVQTILLLGTALVLGWSAPASGFLLAAVVIAIGVAAFSALGLLMGGTLGSELVLALANLLWVILVAIVGLVLYTRGLEDPGWFNLLPSVAMASGLTQGFAGLWPFKEILILLGWAVGASVAASKWFRFS